MEKYKEDNFYPLLESIKNIEDFKNINDLNSLCKEIRKKIIQVVSKNGGHLASNLGAVELTVALHKVFDLSKDNIIWDVGHQCYTHKMLTGRFKDIDTIRKENGISGFTNRNESKYDIFTSGHSSTSISSALGIAQSKKISGEDGSVVAVIGDGALTGGLAYEGLNNAGKLKNFILVLNDNHMSISKNVGLVAKCLTAARMGNTYMKVKNFLSRMLEKTQFGFKIEDLLKQFKSGFKNMVYNKNNIFESMGFAYYGPIDGHNLVQLQRIFQIAKNINKPTVLHVVTSKGKGYNFAQKSPGRFHGVAPFNISTGLPIKKSETTFSSVFGDEICKIANSNNKICAITAAMTGGTGLKKFKENFKKRFFDVGIAEGHSITFAGGLSAGGFIPVFAVYSSFLQRSYDQLIHDVSMQKLKVVLAVDRAGFVGEDGEAHQGLFDVPFLNTIPNTKIYSPAYFEELEKMLVNCIDKDKNILSVVRYPKGKEFFKPQEYEFKNLDYEFFGDLNSKVLIVTYGRIFSNAYKCLLDLKNICVLKLNVIKPINENAVNKSLNFESILFFEESVKSGAVGEKFGYLLVGKFKGNYKVYAVKDEFVAHATTEAQLKKYLLDFDSMKNEILKFLN